MWRFPSQLRPDCYMEFLWRNENHRQREKVNRLQNDPELSRLHSCHLNTKIKVKCPSALGLAGPDACLLEGLAGYIGGIPGHPAQGEAGCCEGYTRRKFTVAGKVQKTMSYQLHTKLSQSQASILLNKMHSYKYEILQTWAVYRRGCESLMPLVDNGLCKQRRNSRVLFCMLFKVFTPHQWRENCVTVTKETAPSVRFGGSTLAARQDLTSMVWKMSWLRQEENAFNWALRIKNMFG